MRKLRVLQVAFNDLGLGGIQNVMMVTVRRMSEFADCDAVVFTSKPSHHEQEFEKYGRIFRVPHYEGKSALRSRLDYYIRYNRVKRAIYKILKENGPYDVVHSHTFFEAAPVLAAARKAGVPVRIAHSHNTARADERGFPMKQLAEAYRRRYRKIILKNATDLVGCSRAAGDYLFGKDRGVVIYNSVDCSKFNPKDYPERNWEELRLVNVGNFVTQKNHPFLIDVFVELLKLKPDCHLTMIGRETELTDKIRARVRELGIEDKVTVLPHNTSVPLALATSDYFLLPSLFEGFPLVMLEAQSMGLHAFVSANITREVDFGLVDFIPLSDGAAAWAKRIYDYYNTSGVEKKPTDMSRFSEESFASQFLEIYKRSIDNE